MLALYIAFGAFGVCAVVTILVQLYIGSLCGKIEREPDNTIASAKLARMRRFALISSCVAGACLIISMIIGAQLR